MKPVRIGIFAIIAFAVLSHGAVEAWARGILEAAAGILLLVWAVPFVLSKKEGPIVLPPLLFPLLALALLATAQLAFRWGLCSFKKRRPHRLAAAAVSAAGAGVAGDRTTGISAHHVSIYNTHRTATDVKHVGSFFPGRASVPHARRLAQLRVVRDDFCISCCGPGNFAALDVQRETLLVP